MLALIKKIVKGRSSYGCWKVTSLIRGMGETINHKRIHRVWKKYGFSLKPRRKRRRRKGNATLREFKARYPNHIWSYDFLQDRTENGNRLKILAVIDEFTRESIKITVSRTMISADVKSVLADLFKSRGKPNFIRSDNGPEFTAGELQNWLRKKGVEPLFIKPGSPWENGFVESFIGKFRTECLNQELFKNGFEAKVIIENWRNEYNNFRPHQSLGGRPPRVFYKDYRRKERQLKVS